MLNSTVKTLLLISALYFFFAGFRGESQKMEPISVSGNDFVTGKGEVVVFHGVNTSDPAKLESDGKWSKSHFQEAKAWGANVIRLPVHPVNWRKLGKDEYLELLDQAMEWAKELELYLIIDWHSIGNLKEEKFQHPMYVTDLTETHEFWNIISERYADEEVLAMYELFNEPTVSDERFGELSWQEWKLINEKMIDIIRKNDPGAVVLVAGFNWAYDLKPVRNNPVNRPGIAYVSHPYPEKRKQPWKAQWEEDWGFVSEKYPLILTEIGYALDDEPGVHIPVHGDETYGNAIVDYSDSIGASWVVWCFDPDWSPVMFFDWDYTPSSQGEFFRKVMLRE